MVKNIILGLLATALLVVIGVGTYYGSSRFLTEPEVIVPDSGQDNSGQATKQDVTDYTPKNVKYKKETNSEIADTPVDELIVSWQHNKAAQSFFYVTPDSTEKIQDVITKWNSKDSLAIKGFWVETSAASKKKTSHEAHMLKSVLDEPQGQTNSTWYFYIIVNTGTYRIPYGETMDENGGPTSPYKLDLNQL